MKKMPKFLGAWISLPSDENEMSDFGTCTWHVVDHQTCVYEQEVPMGMSVSWFQYWETEEGLLRYPLSKTGRSMFKVAESVAIKLESDSLLMNGYRFDRTTGLALPDRIDFFPGTRPDENGDPIRCRFKGELLDHLAEPPRKNDKLS